MARENRGEDVGSDRTGGVLEIFFEWKIRKIGGKLKIVEKLSPMLPSFSIQHIMEGSLLSVLVNSYI